MAILHGRYGPVKARFSRAGQNLRRLRTREIGLISLYVRRTWELHLRQPLAQRRLKNHTASSPGSELAVCGRWCRGGPDGPDAQMLAPIRHPAGTPRSTRPWLTSACSVMVVVSRGTVSVILFCVMALTGPGDSTAVAVCRCCSKLACVGLQRSAETRPETCAHANAAQQPILGSARDQNKFSASCQSRSPNTKRV